MPPSNSRIEHSPVSRAEWWWLGGALLLGAILRLSFPGRMAIEHFDEGVYASNFWFGAEEGYEYPARHLYAPPLLPLVIEWTMIIVSLCGFRPTGFVPMIPCLVAGLATIPSLWWVGRRWFGPTAGIVSAWLVAASDFHSSYSRAALTDVPVCLFILWGVYFIWQALQTGTRRDILLGGLFTGLAWWTKYNGWLPLAIGLAGGAAWQLALPRSERRFKEFGARWLMIAVTACVIWSPVLWGLQKHGGYVAVAANHRQYVVGLSGWKSAAMRQLAHAGFYDGWLDPFFGESTLMEWPLNIDVLNRVIISEIVSRGTTLLLLLAGITACVLWFIRRLQLPTDGVGWLLLAWICGLSIATPFYYPYPRLILPWLIAVWLGVGMATHLLVGSEILFGTSSNRDKRRSKSHLVEVALTVLILLSTFARCQLRTMHAWDDRSKLARAVEGFADEIKKATSWAGYPSDDSIVYVFGDPPIFFALKASGLQRVAPIQSLNFVSTPHLRPTFLVHTGRTDRSDAFKAGWESHQKAFAYFDQTIIDQGHMVRLDLPDNVVTDSIKVTRVR